MNNYEDIKHKLLLQIFDKMSDAQPFFEYKKFRILNISDRKTIDKLLSERYFTAGEKVKLTLKGLFEIKSEASESLISECNKLLPILQSLYLDKEGKEEITLDEVAIKTGKEKSKVGIELYFLTQLNFWSSMNSNDVPLSISVKEEILDIESLTATYMENQSDFKNNNNAKSDVETHSAKKLKVGNKLHTAFSSYSLVEKIGEGGSGKVFSASVEVGGSLVAIKILDSTKVNNEKLKRFKNEYIFCSRNKHPNIITVIDHGLTTELKPFFVMPLYKQSLRKVMDNISSSEAFNLFIKILNGVDAAHKQNVIHRDLKPENILVNEDKSAVVITDFGIAEFSEEDIYTIVETKIGTRLANFQYAAPEQKIRGKSIEKTADIYALGLILNELFTNEIAQGTNYKTIATVAKEYSYLDSFVEKMLQQSPTQRYLDIDEIKKDLAVKSTESISLQKLSILKDTVIPVNEIDDSIVSDPIRIVGVDWDSNVLKLELNQAPNENWISSLRNMRSYSSVMHKDPSQFSFRGSEASISADKHEAQRIIDYFKDWLPVVANIYESKLKRDVELIDRKQREELVSQIKKEQDRIALKSSLKF